ncbi:unnamed protein product [marine sediment metagenome]|uniref:Uncharacterized protein n=1 Tax=marine sediment metagenome TaxID=412755 RepID=X0W0F7_9ZZZZ
MKKCTKCGVEKPIGEFHKDKSYGSGFKARCKKCVNACTKECAAKNPGLTKLRSDNYYKNNKEKINKRASKYRRSPEGRAVMSKINKKRAEEFPKQHKANALIGLEIKRGKVTRPENCTACLKKCKPQAHHHDYDKPLDVIFMCAECHVNWHRNNTPLNKG